MMAGVPALERFRQSLERGTDEYRAAGGRLHDAVAGYVANLSTLCEGMAITARRVLQQDCSVVREVLPYNLEADSFVVRHRFYRDTAQTTVDVTFSNGRVAYEGQEHSLAGMDAIENAIADAVLAFYLPR